MKPISNWENVKAAGSYENLPAGGYVCRIRAAKEKPNKNGAGTHLEILFDVAEGDYRGYFEQDYRAQTGEDKYWRGVIRQNVPNVTSPKYETQCGFFKSFTNAVEDSNPGYHWDWNEAGLKDRLCGVIFAEREKQSQRGTIYVVTNADSVTTVDAVREGKFKVPELKKLVTAGTAFTPIFSSADDSDLPF